MGAAQCLPKAFQQDGQKCLLWGWTQTFWSQESQTTRPTCHSCHEILPLSLSLNMHVFLHWTKTDALAARQYIITRQWPPYRAASCLFTQINLSQRSHLRLTNTSTCRYSSCCTCRAVKQWLVMQNSKFNSSCFFIVALKLGIPLTILIFPALFAVWSVPWCRLLP